MFQGKIDVFPDFIKISHHQIVKFKADQNSASISQCKIITRSTAADML